MRPPGRPQGETRRAKPEGTQVSSAHRLFRRPLIVAAIALAAASGAAWSQAAEGPAWSELSASQREALAPLKDGWSSLDGQSKDKWVEVAGRFHGMPPERQRRVQERMAEWSRLSPEERGQARKNFKESRQLPLEERQRRWEAYQAMTPEQRRALSERAGPRGDNVPPPPRTVSPSSVQAQPGASTTLLSRDAKPPPHQQPGMPKISATPDFVDRSTLLPQRGPQGAGMNKVPPADKPGKPKKHQ